MRHPSPHHDSRASGALSRRAFLRGASAMGVASMALPLFSSMGYSAPSDYPKRLIVFFSGNGSIASSWTPQSSNGKLTELSPILAPLERHRAKLTVLEGIDLTCAKSSWQPKGGFHGHERGLGGILTGTHLNVGTFEAESGYANGVSLDQFLADRIRDPNALHSAQIGLATRYNSWRNRETLSYQDANKPVFHESNGRKLFSRFFGDSPDTSPLYARTQQRRQRVLDYLKDDLRRVKSQISAEDRIRLEQHEYAFTELEDMLSRPALSCRGEEPPQQLDWVDPMNMEFLCDFQFQQLAAAMACDRFRVATIQFGAGLGALKLPFVGLPDEHWHTISHEGDNNAEAQQKLVRVNTYIAERFATLLDALDAMPEGEGETLLDHSVVLWVNELGKGNVHTYDDIPIVMAGKLHGKLVTGNRHVRYGTRHTNDLLITLAHAFGFTDTTTFGIPELCSGPLTELLA